MSDLFFLVLNDFVAEIIVFALLISIVVMVVYLATRRRGKKEFLEKFEVPYNSPDAQKAVYFKVKQAQENVMLVLGRVNMEKVGEKRDVSFLDLLHSWNEQSVPVMLSLQKLAQTEHLARKFGFGHMI